MEDETAAAGADDREETAEPSRGHKIDEGLRWFSEFVFRPFLWFFTHLGLSPNLITILGMAVAIAGGYCLAVSRIPLAAALLILSGILDIVDGYVAKKLDRVTVFGSFLDSVSDRVSDAAMFIGLLVYYLDKGEGIYVGLSLVILVTSFLISYVRARAEALGVRCKAGLMARAPRFLLLAVGLVFNALSPWVLRSVLWIMAVLLLETLIERLIEVWRALER